MDWLEWAFRAASRAEAQEAYLHYIADPTARAWEPDTSQSVVGTDRFKKAAVAAHLETMDRPVPRDCVRFARAPLAAVFADLEADRHNRDALILVAYATHGYRLAEIATFLDIDASTASKAIRRARQRKGTNHGPRIEGDDP